jgi:hypothetical protein
MFNIAVASLAFIGVIAPTWLMPLISIFSITLSLAAGIYSSHQAGMCFQVSNSHTASQYKLNG